MARIPEVETSNAEKIYNLYQELRDAKRDKKESNHAHSDNIKRIENEMKDIVEGEEANIVEAQREA